MVVKNGKWQKVASGSHFLCNITIGIGNHSKCLNDCLEMY